MLTIEKEQSKKIIDPLLEQQHIFSSWVTIQSKALEQNITAYKRIVTPALFAPVIKSNAYGHGVDLVAKLLDAHTAVDRLCIASLREALHLRTLGIKKPILVLSIIDDSLEKAVLADIAVTIYTYQAAYALHEYSKQHKRQATVHIKIDTGLSRLGIVTVEAVEFVKKIAQLPYLYIEGIYTHFANSEDEDPSFMHQQLSAFTTVVDQLEGHGITIPLQHTSCSAAITSERATHRTLARAGIGIYGLWPSQENRRMTLTQNPSFSLHPVLTWKTRIIQIKELPADTYVGYDLTYKTETATKIAVLPVGYWDGYNRALSNNGIVMIDGQYAPVIGKVAMNLMMINISGINAHVDDEVVLLGNAPGITAEDMAAKIGTINYEVVTRINPLLPRLII